MDLTHLETIKRTLENSLEGAVIVDISTARRPIIYCNDTFLKLTGYTRYEVLGQNCRFLQQGEKQQEGLEDIRESLRQKKSCKTVLRNYKKNGDLFFNRLSISPIVNKNNTITHYIGLQDDVTDIIDTRKQLFDIRNENQVLLSEVHHRVKNNLAVFSSLLQLDKWEQEDSELLLKNRMRIKTMSLVHEKLYQKDGLAKLNFGNVIFDFIDAISSDRLFQSDNINLQIDLDRNVVLNINQAIPLALILSELLQNIYHHAFPERKEGELIISLKDQDSLITLVVEDNGVGLPPKLLNGQNLTTGLTIVHTLANQLGGNINLENKTSGGLAASLSFQASDARGSGQANITNPEATYSI